MKIRSKPLVFFGTEDFSAISLKALIEAGIFITFVITKPDSPSGRGHKLKAPAIKKIAEEHDIPVLQPKNVIDILPSITKLKEPVAVLVSYGKIIPESVIKVFSPGVINVHPSLLPRYRGPSPIESAILNGDRETGVSLMKLIYKMDAGPVYDQEKIQLNGKETRLQLYNTLATIGAKLLIEKLPDILDGNLEPINQNETGATYCKLLSKEDGIIAPESMKASTCEKIVRAYEGFPRTHIIINNHPIIILKAHTSTQRDEDTLAIQCKDNNFLIIDQLIAPSGKTMAGKAFLNGYV